jgi:hypothetical protein
MAYSHNNHHFTMTKAREIADEAVEAVWGVEQGTYALNSRTSEYWQQVFQATALALAAIERAEKGVF